jgi:hypothetical protein
MRWYHNYGSDRFAIFNRVRDIPSVRSQKFFTQDKNIVRCNPLDCLSAESDA